MIELTSEMYDGPLSLEAHVASLPPMSERPDVLREMRIVGFQAAHTETVKFGKLPHRMQHSDEDDNIQRAVTDGWNEYLDEQTMFCGR